MSSTGKNIFVQERMTQPNYSMFDLCHDVKLSLKMGYLVPTQLIEVLPGDKFTMSSQAMFRFTAMLAPIMHKVEIYTHHWYVPNRIIWKNWTKFIGAKQPDAERPALPTMFWLTNKSFDTSSLADYMGLPTGVNVGAGREYINALPFAAYQAIYHENYRDQNLQPEFDIELTDGAQSETTSDHLLTLRQRAWEHDYFTSCLPFTQKGDPVSIPFDLTGQSPVVATGSTLSGETPDWRYSNGSVVPDQRYAYQDLGQTGTVNISGSGFGAGYYDPNGTMTVDASYFTSSTTINDLRMATALQKFYELAARGGTRYTEYLRAIYGVVSSDKSLQRPQYIGGSMSAMAISEVLQTSEGTEDSPQGNMAGHGISVQGGRDASFFCEEHGFIMTLVSVRPRTSYQQGLPKLFSKLSYLDYAIPSFAQLGEQPVKNKELYYDTDDENEDTFGYLPIYSDYRFLSSRTHGEMKTTLDHWTLTRQFATRPYLNDDFIRCQPDDRIFATTEGDELYGHIYNKTFARRPLPRFGTPGGI